MYDSGGGPMIHRTAPLSYSRVLSGCYYDFVNRDKKPDGICCTLEMAREIAKAEIKQLRMDAQPLTLEPVISR